MALDDLQNQDFGSLVDAVTKARSGGTGVAQGAQDYLEAKKQAFQQKLQQAGIVTGQTANNVLNHQPLDPNQLLNPEALSSLGNFAWANQRGLLGQQNANSKATEAQAAMMRARAYAQGGASPADKVQNGLEQQYRNDKLKAVTARGGAAALQEGKVNQAIDSMNLFDQHTDPQTGEINLSGPEYTDMALGLAKLLNPSGQVGVQLENEIKQRTLQGDLASIYTKVTGQPAPASSQEIFQRLKANIDRQGQVAEQLRDQITNNIPAPSGLAPQRKQYVDSFSPFSSYTKRQKLTNVSLDQGSTPQQPPAAPQGGPSLPTQGAQAPASPQLSAEDQQAVQWAQSNKNDPRAQKILSLHGMH